jgi:hypothetical protein
VPRRLCEISDGLPGDTDYSADSGRDDARASRQVSSGIGNVGRLLPLAKRLTTASLARLDKRFDIGDEELRRAERQIGAVDRVVLDDALDDTASVDDESPTEIHVGPGYALHLTSDEEALLLLAHELTHVAAYNNNLRPFIREVARVSESRAGVRPTFGQEEDLACDFLGEQALRRFMGEQHSRLSQAERFALAFGYDCGAQADGDGDREHLGQAETLRALLALDPELGQLILSR